VTEKRPYIVAINSAEMGHGEKELGQALIKSFISVLTQQDEYPEKMIFYHGGALLTTKTSSCLADLRTLAEAGVAIYICGSCADYYQIKDEIAVGEITNMGKIVEMLRTAPHVVKP